MNKQYRYDQLYMDIAKRCAEMSYAVRAKVGCLIVRDGRILSQGWNGMPAGMPNICEDEHVNENSEIVLKTKPEVSHAEENALLKLARSSETSEGATAYVTLQPCINCSKLLYNAGIKRIVYAETYRDRSGVELLEKMGVVVYSL